MVSVMAVNIQFSSLIGLLRSCKRPGTLMASSLVKLEGSGFSKIKKVNDISIGDVNSAMIQGLL